MAARVCQKYSRVKPCLHCDACPCPAVDYDGLLALTPVCLMTQGWDDIYLTPINKPVFWQEAKDVQAVAAAEAAGAGMIKIRSQVKGVQRVGRWWLTGGTVDGVRPR